MSTNKRDNTPDALGRIHCKITSLSQRLDDIEDDIKYESQRIDKIINEKMSHHCTFESIDEMEYRLQLKTIIGSVVALLLIIAGISLVGMAVYSLVGIWNSIHK